MAGELRKSCPHSLAPREHHRLFYDTTSGIWTKRRRLSSQLEQSIMAGVNEESCQAEVCPCQNLIQTTGLSLSDDESTANLAYVTPTQVEFMECEANRSDQEGSGEEADVLLADATDRTDDQEHNTTACTIHICWLLLLYDSTRHHHKCISSENWRKADVHVHIQLHTTVCAYGHTCIITPRLRRGRVIVPVCVCVCVCL